MRTSSLLIGILAVSIVVGAVYFATRTGTKSMIATSHGKQYTNEEKWLIKYNDDGLPTEIIINRKAVQQ